MSLLSHIVYNSLCYLLAQQLNGSDKLQQLIHPFAYHEVFLPLFRFRGLKVQHLTQFLVLRLQHRRIQSIQLNTASFTGVPLHIDQSYVRNSLQKMQRMST